MTINMLVYVWLDALTNYLSALNYPNMNDLFIQKSLASLIHFIGKDIFIFMHHWPAY